MYISIVIATYNASATLERCLKSIIPQMNDEIELIIIDGKSNDGTKEIINRYIEWISYTISEKDSGVYDAWNKGIEVAKGDWVMFIGADDILLPNALNIYIQTIVSTSDINTYDYICAHNKYLDKRGKLLKVLGEEPVWNKMKKKMVAAHVASLHNRQNLFNTIGCYNLKFKICADYELLLRKKSNLKYIMLDAYIAQMQVGGISFSTKAIKESMAVRALHRSVSKSVNSILFIRDLCAYKFFIIRKLKGNLLRNFINVIVSKVKGVEYYIDEDLPLVYLLRLMASKSTSCLYGMIRLRTLKRVFIHPSASIKCASKLSFGKNFTVGRDCYLDAVSHRGLICGDNVSMGYLTHIELTGSLHLLGQGMKIGNNVGLGTHGHYGSGAGFVDIGDNTIFGNYVSIHPENHVIDDIDKTIKLQGVRSKGGVKIGCNCWIGAKVTILDGTEIGNGCVVAAGAVVTGKFPDNVIIGGIPAKILKYRS